MHEQHTSLRQRIKKATFGFRWRLNAIFGTLLFLIVLLNASGNIITQQSLLEDRLNTRIDEIARLMAEVSASFLYDQRLDELEIIFEDVYAQDDVTNIIVVDLDRIILVDGKPQSDLLLVEVELPIVNQTLASGKRVRESHNDIERIAVPVVYNLDIQGAVLIDISRKVHQSELETIFQTNLLSGIAFVVIALFVCNLVASHLAKPLRTLKEFTRRVSDGFLEERVNIRSNDEVEELSDAVNNMVAKLSNTMDEVHELAYRDKLTGLRNRVWFNGYIERYFETTNATARMEAALFILDLDRFKFINDTYGHHAGDELLVNVAAKLRSLIVDDLGIAFEVDDNFNNKGFKGTLARLGGDEFIAFLPKAGSKAKIQTIAEHIVDAFQSKLRVGGNDQSITISIGIATFDREVASFEDLFKMADAAMYQAKSTGKNNYQFFNAALAKEAVDRIQLENELRAAIDNEQFEAHFQPQVNIKTGRIQGAEALLRWNHPTRGIVAPGAFLSTAIEANLMVPIGRCVYINALRTAGRLVQSGKTDLKVSLNATTIELEEPDFAEFLLNQIRLNGLRPAQIEIEITEDTLMRYDGILEHQIGLLKAEGIRIAVDDFGIGYSNLSRLRQLRFNTLKIDRSLMFGLGADEEAEGLIRSILSMAASLGLSVVAEGVEDTKQLEVLHRYDCELIQGYLFFKPMDTSMFEALLAANEPLETATTEFKQVS